jgi:hypothetical protein
VARHEADGSDKSHVFGIPLGCQGTRHEYAALIANFGEAPVSNMMSHITTMTKYHLKPELANDTTPQTSPIDPAR